MRDTAFSPARQLADAVRHGELSPVALVQSCPDRIDALNPSLKAFVALRRGEALEEAGALQKLIAAGKRLGPLAGLPVGMKDLEDVAGLPTTYGSLPVKDYRACYRGLPHGKAITPAFTGQAQRKRAELLLPASYADERARPWNDRWSDL